jgi:protein-arginine kinase activator protein McsA
MELQKEIDDQFIETVFEKQKDNDFEVRFDSVDTEKVEDNYSYVQELKDRIQALHAVKQKLIDVEKYELAADIQKNIAELKLRLKDEK